MIIIQPFHLTMRSLIAILFLIVLFSACSKDAEEKCAFIPETSGIKVSLRFESLEDSLPAVSSKAELVGFLSRHKEIRDLLFNRAAYPNDSVFIKDRFTRFVNPAIDTLLMDTHQVFGTGNELRKEFEQAFANLTYYYPDVVLPKVETMITGLESDIFLNDSLVIVCLDHFLGERSKFKPYMHEYMQRRYNKSFIVPSVMLLYGIDGMFNAINPNDKTALAEMIAYGKAYYFAKQMQPCVPDSVFIGYTAEEIAGSRKNESLIWSRLIEDQVLFSTSHQIKQKFIAERPKTLEVGEKCPGRIGQWIGWQIVKKYMATHADVTLLQLMKMQDAATLFRESGYKPQVVKLPKTQTN
jgi:hypothetical protein